MIVTHRETGSIPERGFCFWNGDMTYSERCFVDAMQVLDTVPEPQREIIARALRVQRGVIQAKNALAENLASRNQKLVELFPIECS